MQEINPIPVKIIVNGEEFYLDQFMLYADHQLTMDHRQLPAGYTASVKYQCVRKKNVLELEQTAPNAPGAVEALRKEVIQWELKIR